jgi:hypothetical protein
MITTSDVRQLALAMPEAQERETWGEATFRVRDKIFMTLSPDGKTASVKASVSDQAALITTEPGTFAKAHYTGRYGWVTVQLASVDPEVMRELVVEAWRRTAPKRLVDGPSR